MNCEHRVDVSDESISLLAVAICSLMGSVRVRAWRAPLEWIELLDYESVTPTVESMIEDALALDADATRRLISRELSMLYSVSCPELLARFMHLSLRHSDFPLYLLPGHATISEVTEILVQADRVPLSQIQWSHDGGQARNYWLLGWNSESHEYISVAFSAGSDATFSSYLAAIEQFALSRIR